MAEVLGVAASGIAVVQVAGAVGGALLRLKQLWSEIQDVPESIADLLEQIECLNLELFEAEQTVVQAKLPPHVWNDRGARRSTEYYQRALKDLSNLVNDLSADIDSVKQSRLRRNIAHLRVVLKKDQLKKLEHRLETAVRMLQGAQQGYIITLLKLQPDIIVGKVVSQLNGNVGRKQITSDNAQGCENVVKSNIQQSPSYNNILVPFQSNSSNVWKRPGFMGRLDYQMTTNKYAVQFQPPYWLSGSIYAFDMIIGRTTAGWTTHLRHYNVRPHNSRIFSVVRSNSVDMLRQLFSTGEASPWDKTEEGWTLLHLAISDCCSDVVEFLVTLNPDPAQLNSVNDYPAASINTGCTDEYDQLPLEQASDIADLCINHNLIPERDARRSCKCPKVADSTLFWRLRPLLCPEHERTPAHSRLMRAWGLSVMGSLQVECIKDVLDPDFTTDIYGLCSIPEYPLAHTLASVIAMHLSDEYWYGVSPFDAHVAPDWVDFGVRVIRHTANLHCKADWKRAGECTPLTLFINDILRTVNSKILHVTPFLRHWLQILYSAEVDLVQYGDEENRFLPTEYPLSYERIFRFKVGPKVEDWDILWFEPSDHFAGEFWDLVENPLPKIPGGWVE